MIIFEDLRNPFVSVLMVGMFSTTILWGQKFQDVTTEAGIDFTHFNGMTGDFYLPEIMGSGCALFDMDGDGDLDLYLVQGALINKNKTLDQALVPWREEQPPMDRLFRNEGLKDGIPQFKDITAKSGIRATGIGMGVATGDFDNDGHVDLYLTNLGANQLWRNRGDGTFEDVTASAGVGDERWSTSALFVDIDRDGDLDIYVANYVFFDQDHDPKCYTPDSARDYCGPQAYRPVGDRLFRNRGNGTFENASHMLQVNFPNAPGLGVVAGDFNGDGWPDLVIANDGAANLYWSSQGKGKFLEDGMFGGVAVNGAGAPEASMGIAVGDYDNDGDEDLFMTHLDGETNTLYANLGSGLYEDRTNVTKLGAVSQSFTGFGTVWLDLERDGWLDLICLNGAVKKVLGNEDSILPLQQRNQLFASRKGKYFEEITAEAGPVFEEIAVSRGLAIGDLDNDGDDDLVLTNNNGRARVVLNRWGDGKPWIGLDLRDIRGMRPAIGAKVWLTRKDGGTALNTVRTDGSFISARDPRLPLAIPDGYKAIKVQWLDGKTKTWTDLKPGKYHQLSQKDAD